MVGLLVGFLVRLADPIGAVVALAIGASIRNAAWAILGGTAVATAIGEALIYAAAAQEQSAYIPQIGTAFIATSIWASLGWFLRRLLNKKRGGNHEPKAPQA